MVPVVLALLCVSKGGCAHPAFLRRPGGGVRRRLHLFGLVLYIIRQGKSLVFRRAIHRVIDFFGIIARAVQHFKVGLRLCHGMLLIVASQQIAAYKKVVYNARLLGRVTKSKHCR